MSPENPMKGAFFALEQRGLLLRRRIEMTLTRARRPVKNSDVFAYWLICGSEPAMGKRLSPPTR
jgi:hypothetical protein